MSNSHPIYSALSGFVINHIPFLGYALNERVTQNLCIEDLKTYTTAAHVGAGISILGYYGQATISSVFHSSPIGIVIHGALAYGGYMNYSDINQILDNRMSIEIAGIIGNQEYSV